MVKHFWPLDFYNIPTSRYLELPVVPSSAFCWVFRAFSLCSHPLLLIKGFAWVLQPVSLIWVCTAGILWWLQVCTETLKARQGRKKQTPLNQESKMSQESCWVFTSNEWNVIKKGMIAWTNTWEVAVIKRTDGYWLWLCSCVAALQLKSCLKVWRPLNYCELCTIGFFG